MKRIPCFIVFVAALAAVLPLSAQTDSLITGFRTPPREARPQVWWHWMNGNITKDGIRKDLLWMDKIGLGGIHLFDAGLETPQVVKKRVEYMTPEWKDCFRYALHLADSLQMEVTMTSAPGWSNTGGPWVTTEDAMKRIEWSDTVVVGGGHRRLMLPQPSTVSGIYQGIRLSHRGRQYPYYRDLYVLAVRIPDGELSMAEMGAKVTSSSGTFSVARLTDGDYETMDTLTIGKKGNSAWLAIEFDKPQLIKSVSVGCSRSLADWNSTAFSPLRYLECSDDGVSYRKVCNIANGGLRYQTVDIPDTRAKYFRLVFKGKNVKIGVSELILRTVDRVNHAEEKAGFAGVVRVGDNLTPATADATPLSEVIDISDKMAADGTLSWDAPSGKWRILRFGYSLTGKENHPASPEATGLEVDKLDRDAVRRYMDHYLASYHEAADTMMGKKGIQYLLIDSYEAGCATWTARMRDEFTRRRGYDLLPWLPALAGQILQSGAQTDQFLFDYRQTLGELITENLFGQVTDIAHDHGLKTYFEAMEDGRPFIADGMSPKMRGDIPMAALWARASNMKFNDQAFGNMQNDVLESASAAHLMGKKLVAAESLTAYGYELRDTMAYNYYPNNLKRAADLEFASGVNRIVIHESAHQPVDSLRPGLSLAQYGQWFTRLETWANLAKPWIDYLSRSSFLLQAGRPVADVAYYYGEEANATALFNKKQPPVPRSAAFDYVNTEALTTLLYNKDSLLVSPSGMEYRLLVLDKNTHRMTLPALRSLHKLALAGVNIVGKRPTTCLGLLADTVEFRKLADDIWNSGRKNVMDGKSIAVGLEKAGVLPDFSSYKMDSLRYVHRILGTTDIYWVNNRSNQVKNDVFRFRVTGKQPRIWRPETGEIQEVGYAIGTQTTYVDATMQPGEAFFVVFDGRPHEGLRHKVARSETLATHTLSTPWRIQFPEGMGVPREITLDTLRSLTDITVAKIAVDGAKQLKYFSGTATYTNHFSLSQTDISGHRVVIDLGEVNYVAELIVNGRNLGVVWQSPFRVDITDAVREGDNQLEIRVTNTWRNRLIGDKLAKKGEPRYTFTSFKWSNRARYQLTPTGLVGPVCLKIETTKLP